MHLEVDPECCRSRNQPTDSAGGGSNDTEIRLPSRISPNTPVDVVSGTLTISAPIVNGRGSSSPFPELASSLTKTGNGSLVLSGANAYTGGTTVSAGTLVVSGSVLGDVTLAAGSRLGGTGSFAGTVGGAGIFGPGTSPGITTTGSIDPSGGLGLEFEITGSLPAWANPTASVNDVIRITGGNPFTSALSAATTISILLGVPGLDPAALGTYTAGFLHRHGQRFHELHRKRRLRLLGGRRVWLYR